MDIEDAGNFLLGNTFLGRLGQPPIDWRNQDDLDEEEEDDRETPHDVVRMLGFDPSKEPY